MRTDHAITRPSNEPVFMRTIVDRQTPVKTLPCLAVGKYATLVNTLKFGLYLVRFTWTFLFSSIDIKSSTVISKCANGSFYSVLDALS